MSMLPTGPLPNDLKQKSPTQQHQAKSADIQFIMKQFNKTGLVNHINAVQGRYEDYPTAFEFKEAQDLIANAKSMFETVPHEIRAKFHNEPGEFVDFMTNEANRDAIFELGIDPDWLPEPVTPTEAAPTASEPVPETEPPATS